MAKKPKRLAWWYFLARYVMLLIFKVIHPYKIVGKENVPGSGRTLICSNHVTYGDPIYVACAVAHRQLHFMAKAELFKNPIAGAFLRSLGAFPISRGTGGAEGIQTAIRLIEEEEVVCMFPEGTRSKTGELLNMKTGASMLAEKTQCTVVPVAIVGKGGTPPRIFHRMMICVGTPIPAGELGLNGGSPSGYRAAARKIQESVRVMREDAIREMDRKGKAA